MATKNSPFIIWSLLFIATVSLIASGIYYILNERLTGNSLNDADTPVIQGVILSTPKPVGNFELIQSNGHIFNQQNLKGNWSLFFIGYTNCPDICPTTMATLKQSISLIDKQQLTIPRVIFVSIDPERDDRKMLGEYVRYFSPDFIGVTSDDATLNNFTQRLGVFYKKETLVDEGSTQSANAQLKNNDYLMAHSSSLILINPDAEIQAIFTGPHTAKSIKENYSQTINWYQKIKQHYQE